MVVHFHPQVSRMARLLAWISSKSVAIGGCHESLNTQAREQQAKAPVY
jgi:hypothetical protein